jgi:hypothetical protein
MLKHSDGVCGKAAKFMDMWAEKLGTNFLNTTIAFVSKLPLRKVSAESLCSSVAYCPSVSVLPDRSFS